MEFNHIRDVEEFLSNSCGLDDLKDRLGEIPRKFGDFEILEIDRENNLVIVRNTYYDDNSQDYEIEDLYIEDILLYSELSDDAIYN